MRKKSGKREYVSHYNPIFNFLIRLILINKLQESPVLNHLTFDSIG